MCDGEKILGSLDINVGLTHSEGLVPQLDTLLKLARVSRNDHSLDIPLRAVDTLKAIAYNLPVAGVLLAPVLDAQKGNLYLGQYQWDQGRLEEAAPVSIVPAKTLVAELEQKSWPVILMGECRRVPKPEGLLVTLAPESARMPRGSAVAILAAEEYEEGEIHDYFGMEPYYIRRSEAEELWEKRQKQQRSGR